jgi:hypothetical protein
MDGKQFHKYCGEHMKRTSVVIYPLRNNLIQKYFYEKLCAGFSGRGVEGTSRLHGFEPCSRDAYLSVYVVCVLSCVGSDRAMSGAPIQGPLQIVSTRGFETFVDNGPHGFSLMDHPNIKRNILRILN